MERSGCLRIANWGLIAFMISLSTVSAEDRANSIPVTADLDQLVADGCRSTGTEPLNRCSDSEFLRRIWLDLAGRTPPLADVVKLSTNPQLDRLNRGEVIHRLLTSAEFSRHWGRLWAEYLTDKRTFETEGYDGRRLQQFLTTAFQENLPYADLVSNLVLGEGTSDISGSSNFLLRYNAEPIPLAGAVSQKFLGLTMHCAECHDHPHAHWKQKDFLGLAAHFARLRKMTPTNPQDGESFFVVIERPRGELTIVDKRSTPDENGGFPRRTIFPQLPGHPRTHSVRPRRDIVVEWMIDPQTPYLSRHLVNLIWERLLGERLVQNLDQWPPATPTTNTEILNLLADDCIHHAWNLQRLIQIITQSDTYQRSSHPANPQPTGADGPQRDLELANWSRARIRPLSADQIHLSIGQGLGYHFDENDYRLAEATGEEFTQDIPANNLGLMSLSLSRSLSLYNSDYVRGAVELGAEVTVRLYGPITSAEHIERLFLSLLSRRPTTEEIEFFQDLGSENDPHAGLQDIVWVLLNSAEFVTNH